MREVAPELDPAPWVLSRDFKNHDELWQRVGKGLYRCLWLARKEEANADAESRGAD